MWNVDLFHDRVIGCYDGREIVLGNSLNQVMDFMEEIRENLMIFFRVEFLEKKNGCKDQDEIESRNWELLEYVTVAYCVENH